MDTKSWIDVLSDEDRVFLRRFLLASGSLKEVAAGYGISYPTVRLRLDRLIAKIEVFEDLTIRSEFERTVRGMRAEGRIDEVSMGRLLDIHNKELEARDDETSDD